MDYFKSCDKEMSYDQQCSYCGSISIEKAIKLLSSKGTKFSGSDWKYGYPHKFYIDEVNPNSDETIQIGSTSKVVDGVRLDTPILGKKLYLHHKFYTEHLLHASKESFDQFNVISKKCFDIEWAIVEDRRLRWHAIPGIQLWGIIEENGQPVHGII